MNSITTAHDVMVASIISASAATVSAKDANIGSAWAGLLGHVMNEKRPRAAIHQTMSIHISLLDIGIADR
jgi:hypothetical protein